MTRRFEYSRQIHGYLAMNQCLIYTLLAVALFAADLAAQSITIIGGGTLATDCYQRSVDATQFGNASFADTEICDKAIYHGQLTRQDLQATYVNRGVLYAALGKFDYADKDYQQALALGEEVAEIYLNRGNLKFMLERFQEAIEDYNKAQELGLKQTHILHLNRGMAFENRGLLDAAEQNYLMALEIVPDWRPAVEKLQRVWQKYSQILE